LHGDTGIAVHGLPRDQAKSTAWRLRSRSEQWAKAALCVARRTTRGAWLASNASCQRDAHKHQRSPGFRPGKPSSGIGVERLLPRDLELEKRGSHHGADRGYQYPLVQYCSTRPDKTPSWGLWSKRRAARQAHYGMRRAHRFYCHCHPSALPAPFGFALPSKVMRTHALLTPVPITRAFAQMNCYRILRAGKFDTLWGGFMHLPAVGHGCRLVREGESRWCQRVWA